MHHCIITEFSAKILLVKNFGGFLRPHVDKIALLAKDSERISRQVELVLGVRLRKYETASCLAHKYARNASYTGV